jgi:hypothetical protein
MLVIIVKFVFPYGPAVSIFRLSSVGKITQGNKVFLSGIGMLKH